MINFLYVFCYLSNHTSCNKCSEILQRFADQVHHYICSDALSCPAPPTAQDQG